MYSVITRYKINIPKKHDKILTEQAQAEDAVSDKLKLPGKKIQSQPD